MKLIIDIEPRYCKYMDSDVKELYYEAINRITEAVRNGIPYEEKQGEWITIIGYANVRAFICDKCNGFNDLPTNYCPNCGASLKLGKKIEGGAE